MDILSTVFWGIVVLLVLVVVHELGHFIAARAFGVRVTEFMIGLPGPSVGFEKNGTRYGVTAIPLGGYNRITGMESGPEDPNLEKVLAYAYRQGSVDVEHTALACDISEEDAEMALVVLDGWGSLNAPGRSNKTEFYAAPKTDKYDLGEAREVSDPAALLNSERSQTYRALPCWKRLAVLFAGPLMNVLLAFVLFLILFCGIGLTQASTTLSATSEDSPAAAAGMQAGDTLVSVGGSAIESWSDVSVSLQDKKPGDKVTIEYTRDGQQQSVDIVLADNGSGGALIGIVPGTEQVRLSPGEAIGASWTFLVMTVQSYASLFNPSTAAETLGQSTSVVGIAVMSGQAASAGVSSLLYLMAVISLSLGIVNLLPIPPLDGGKIVVEVIQRIRRKEISAKVINAITIVAIALLLLLFAFMLRQDIVRFVLGG